MNELSDDDLEALAEMVQAILEGDGNDFAVMGRVVATMRRAGFSAVAIAAYRAEAMSGDYEHLLVTSVRWVGAAVEASLRQQSRPIVIGPPDLNESPHRGAPSLTNL